MPPLRSVGLYGLSLLCALLFILQFKGWPLPCVVQMEVQTDRYARLELLYDQGAGFRTQDSVHRLAQGGPAFRLVRFPIAASQIRNLSLLQEDGSDRFRLRRVQLKAFGRNPIEIPIDRIRAAGPWTNVTRYDDGIEVKAINSNANLAIGLQSRVEETRTARRLRATVLIALCGSVVALALLSARWGKTADSLPMLAEKQRLVRNAVVVFLFSAYLLASLAKLNGSATAHWRIYADREAPNAGLILGTPKAIRSDEWVGETPWILSQAARQPPFPLKNPGVGEQAMPLLNNLPVQHWSMLFRPQMWGFFIADVETAFAFYWNYKWFSLLLGAFLLLYVAAHRNPGVGLFGALFLFFSPFIQWWFSTPTAMPEMIGAFFLALWSLIVIRSAKSQLAILGGGILLVASIAQFVFCAYPRFQVPLIYFGGLLAAAALVSKRRNILGPSLVYFRVVVLVIAGAAAVAILLAWYHEVAGAIQRVRALAYPGQVFSLGGGLPWQRLFMPFLEFAMTDQHYPASEMNVCEPAGFLFIAPLIAVVFGDDLLKRRFDPILAASLALTLVSVWFMLFGFPARLAGWTGFSLVYPERLVLAVSIASIVALCRYLGRTNERGRNQPIVLQLAAFVALVLILLAIFRSTNRQLGHFVDYSGVVACAFFFALVFAALWYRQVVMACVLVLVPSLCSSAPANPIGRGLPGFTRSNVFHWLAGVAHEQPEAKWLVVGHVSSRTGFIPQFVKATGASVLGGYRCEPDEEMVRALDPTGKYSSVYRRYAAVLFLPSAEPEPSFELVFVNRYNVLLPLRPDILDRLGVRLVLEVELPENEGAISGYRPIGEREGLRLLQRNTR
jgi:hypothetical protein